MEEKKRTNDNPRDIQKVVSSNVTVKKRGKLSKLKDEFSADKEEVSSFLWSDVIIPTIKNTIMDVMNMVMFKGERPNYRNQNRSSNVISYNQYYKPNNSNSRPATRRNAYSFDDEIIFDTYREAEDVLYHMDSIIDRYGAVRVADLFELIGVSGRYTDNNYGWVNLDGAKPQRLIGGGYTLKLPRVIPLD